MQLQLAKVLFAAESGCSVELLESCNQEWAQYAPPMVDYKILASPGDLVAATTQNESFQIVFRWKRVQVKEVKEDQVLVQDHEEQVYTLPLSPDFAGKIVIGVDLFTDNSIISDIVAEDRPLNPERLQSLYFPKINKMYEQIETAHNVDPKAVVAQGYDQIYKEHLDWSQKIRVEERARYTSLLLTKLPPQAKVLDIGCGTGLLTTKVLAQRFQVTGVDISLRHIEMAKETVPNATFIHADVTELDFPPDSFAGIVAFYSLFHLPRAEQAELFRRVAMWLRPGGYFVATLAAKSFTADIEENWFGAATMYWSSYDSETNKRLIQEAGLQIISAEKEAAQEFDKEVTLLWIVAQKPG
jgi:SAM-dependent methyltransferase